MGFDFTGGVRKPFLKDMLFALKPEEPAGFHGPSDGGDICQPQGNAGALKTLREEARAVEKTAKQGQRRAQLRLRGGQGPVAGVPEAI